MSTTSHSAGHSYSGANRRHRNRRKLDHYLARKQIHAHDWYAVGWFLLGFLALGLILLALAG